MKVLRCPEGLPKPLFSDSNSGPTMGADSSDTPRAICTTGDLREWGLQSYQGQGQHTLASECRTPVLVLQLSNCVRVNCNSTGYL